MALPNGPMEIVFSFDTTGSMCSCLDEVRGRVQDMVQRLQSDIPGIRIAIFAHGDYCDKGRTYVIKYEDLTDDVPKLCNFAKSVGGTGGGDADECYELVMHQVRTKLSWTPGSQRALVLIGDCNPHEPDYPQNTLKLNWRDEADELGRNGVRIYSVQCKDTGAGDFYKSIADRTSGRHLKLDQFQNIFDFIMAVCYREKGGEFLDNYEKEVRARCGPVHKDLHQLFGDLRDSDPSDEGLSTASPMVVDAKPVEKPSKVLPPKTKSPALKILKRNSLKAKGWEKMKVTKALKAYKEDQLPRLKRENVPQTNFMLRDMSWSKWNRVIHPNCPEYWRKRSGDGCGYRAPVIFHGRTNVPAIYEVAVQPAGRVRPFVVYCKTSKGFSRKSNWEKCLLGKSDIKTQIDKVVKQNCTVFMRRAVLKSEKEQDKLRPALKRYDYAWKSISSVRKCHRDCTKMSVHISDKSLGL